MAKRAAQTPIDRIAIVPGSGPTLHRRIYGAILDAIASGKLAAGSRLPSTRALSAALGVSRNSVMHAFEQLHAEGYLEPRTGSGTRVAGRLPKSTLRRTAPLVDPMRPAGAKLAGILALSGYPVDQKELEDWDGNRIYLYQS